MQVYNKEVSHAKNGEIKNCFHEKTTRAIKIENLSIDINIDARLRRLGGLLLLPAILERAVRQSTATYTPISIAISVLVGVAAAEEVDAGRLTGEEADRRRTVDTFTLLFLHQRLSILWIHYVALSRQVRTVLLLRINTGHAAQPAKDSLPNNHSITKFLTQIYEKQKEKRIAHEAAAADDDEDGQDDEEGGDGGAQLQPADQQDGGEQGHERHEAEGREGHRGQLIALLATRTTRHQNTPHHEQLTKSTCCILEMMAGSFSLPSFTASSSIPASKLFPLHEQAANQIKSVNINEHGQDPLTSGGSRGRRYTAGG